MYTRYRSFFWPAVLILGGLLALLVNTDVIPGDRLYLLLYLWPVILIVIGLELIVRRTMTGQNADLAAALIVVLAIAGAAGYVAVAPNPAGHHTHDWSGPAGGLEKLAVDIEADAATTTISASTAIGEDLYRAHIEYSGPQPQVELDRSSGTLRIIQAGGTFLDSRSFVLKLQLSPSVPLASLTLDTGASRDDITLGPPSGVVPVQINGAAMTVHIHRPTGTRYSVDVSGGAITLDADGHHSGGVGSASYATGDLGSAAYKIQVNGGACTVTVDSGAPSD